MSDPPDDPDRGHRSEPDSREPRPNRRRTDAEHRATDRHRGGDGRGTDDRHEVDATRDRTGQQGTDPTGPRDAVDRNRGGRAGEHEVRPSRHDERAGAHADDARDRGADAGALRWLTGVVSLVGLWLATSAFVYETTPAALWNNAVVGVAVFLLAGYGFYRLARNSRPDVGSTGLAALLGLWTVAAPFLLPYPSDALVWSTVASGVAVAVLSGYNAYESRRSTATGATGSRA